MKSYFMKKNLVVFPILLNPSSISLRIVSLTEDWLSQLAPAELLLACRLGRLGKSERVERKSRENCVNKWKKREKMEKKG